MTENQFNGTTHTPTVHDNNGQHPRYTIDWNGATPQPGDMILMSTELFQQWIDTMNQPAPIAYIYKAGTNQERHINPADITTVRPNQ